MDKFEALVRYTQRSLDWNENTLSHLQDVPDSEGILLDMINYSKVKIRAYRNILAYAEELRNQ